MIREAGLTPPLSITLCDPCQGPCLLSLSFPAYFCIFCVHNHQTFLLTSNFHLMFLDCVIFVSLLKDRPLLFF